jgi:hypothetical protein
VRGGGGGSPLPNLSDPQCSFALPEYMQPLFCLCVPVLPAPLSGFLLSGILLTGTLSYRQAGKQ